MIDQKENEEINEELSTDELKSASGGISATDAAGNFTALPGLGDAYLQGLTNYSL